MKKTKKKHMSPATKAFVTSAVTKAVDAGWDVLSNGRRFNAKLPLPQFTWEPLHRFSEQEAKLCLEKMTRHYIQRKMERPGDSKERLNAFVKAASDLTQFDKWAIDHCMNRRFLTQSSRIFWPPQQLLADLRDAALIAIGKIGMEPGKQVLHNPVWESSPEAGLVRGLWPLYFAYVEMPKPGYQTQSDMSNDFASFVESVVQPIRDAFCGSDVENRRESTDISVRTIQQRKARERGMVYPPDTIETIAKKIIPEIHKISRSEVNEFLELEQQNARANSDDTRLAEIARIRTVITEEDSASIDCP